MKKLLLISMFIFHYQSSGMESDKPTNQNTGSFHELKEARTKKRNVENSASSSALEQSHSTNTVSNPAETVMATSASSEAVSEDAKKEIEALNKRIKQLSPISRKSPVSKFDENASFGEVVAWLTANQSKLLSKEAKILADATVERLQDCLKQKKIADEIFEKNPNAEHLEERIQQLETAAEKIKMSVNKIITLENSYLRAVKIASKNLAQSRENLLKSPSPSPRPKSATPTPVPETRATTPTNTRRFNTVEDRLLYAIERGLLKDILSIIIDQRIQINNMQDDLSNRSPLHVSSIHGRTTITYVLLEHGAAVDVKDRHHMTPLMYAIKYNHPETAYMLIYHGNANVNLGNGELPLDAVLHKIQFLYNDDPSIEAWLMLERLIRERNGMTREEMLQQVTFSPSPTPSSSSSLSSPQSRSTSTTPFSPVEIIDQPRIPVAVRPVAAASSSAICHLPEAVDESKRHTNHHSCCITSMSSSGACSCAAPSQSSSSRQQAERLLTIDRAAASEFKMVARNRPAPASARAQFAANSIVDQRIDNLAALLAELTIIDAKAECKQNSKRG